MYAGTLLKAARSVVHPGPLAMGAISGKDDLLKRILFFTKEINQITMKKRFNPVSYALLLLVACFTLFCFSGQKKSTPALAYTPIMLPGYQFEISGDAKSVKKEIAPVTTYAMTQYASKQKAQPNIAETATAPEATGNYNRYMHTGNKETIEKEVTIVEECPVTGKTTTRVFKSIYINGRWIAQPVYTLTETTSDSCNDEKTDSVIVTQLHPEQ